MTHEVKRVNGKSQLSDVSQTTISRIIWTNKKVRGLAFQSHRPWALPLKCRRGTGSASAALNTNLSSFSSHLSSPPAASELQQRSCQSVSRQLRAPPESTHRQLSQERECAQVHLLWTKTLKTPSDLDSGNWGHPSNHHRATCGTVPQWQGLILKVTTGLVRY